MSDDGYGEPQAPTQDKRVSWVELYFDLVFVFAVGQAAHTIVAQPTWRGVAITFALFAALWWTWIGFVVLLNRQGEDTPGRRLVVLAGTVTCSIAAIEVHGVGDGHTEGFAVALALNRVLLAFAFGYMSDPPRAAGRRIALGYVVSAVLFALSGLVPTPLRYAVWGVAMVQEGGLLLLGSARWRRPRGLSGVRRTLRRDRGARPSSPGDQQVNVDAGHLAERFGLFMIILLGEVVIAVCGDAISVQHRDLRYWIGLIAGLVLAGALWWIYFTSAADINEHTLRRSGGNPAVAYGLYAGGHLLPAFSLLVISAGISLSLGEHPPTAAAWLVTAGLAGVVFSARTGTSPSRSARSRIGRLALAAATVCLALLQDLITTGGVLVLTTVYAIGVAAYVSVQHTASMAGNRPDPLAGPPLR